MITTIINSLTIVTLLFPSAIQGSAVGFAAQESVVPEKQLITPATTSFSSAEDIVALAEQGMHEPMTYASPIPLIQEVTVKTEEPDTSEADVVQSGATPVVSEPAPVASESVTTPTVTSFDDVYKAAGEKYGVPWQVLYGLHITETGGRDGMIMNGSGSGARGPMQFMPGTWRAYGVDGDGDGVANIDSAVDAIHGAANFLAKHGSLEAGLRSYGGNTSRTLTLAHERGLE